MNTLTSETSEKTKKITVMVVDDHRMVRSAMRALIDSLGPYEVVADSGDAREAIEVASQLQPDVVLLDITMPGLSGLDAVVPLKRACPRTRVVMASHHESQRFVRAALEAGADGYLSKESDPAELQVAFDAVLRGESFVSPRVANALVARFVGGNEISARSSLDVLTPREREVFQLLAVGKTNKQVAAVLGVSLATVKKHRENLQRKLDCHSAAEIARLAIREGLLSA